jgi:hypothetical protein
MQSIRNRYNVPAKRGMRVVYTGGAGRREGVITGSRDTRLLIRMDGEESSFPHHPTWKLEYPK